MFESEQEDGSSRNFSGYIPFGNGFSMEQYDACFPKNSGWRSVQRRGGLFRRKTSQEVEN